MSEEKKKTLRRTVLRGLVCLAVLIPTALCGVLALALGSARQPLPDLSQAPPAASAPEAPAAPEAPEEPQESGKRQVTKQSPPLPAEVPPWQALYPDLYALPADRGSVEASNVVYLTFDDGPSARTPEVLAILERYGIQATFFVTGREDEQSWQWMRDIVAAGHTLGVHSYTHNYQKIYASVEAFLEDFNRMYQQILEVTGVAPQVFRFPGGSINSYNGLVYLDIVSEMVRRGFVYFDWNAMTGDAVKKPPAPDVQARNALAKLGADRVILLSHDSAKMTNMVAALPSIIEGYRNAGYTFSPLTPEVVPIVYAYPR